MESEIRQHFRQKAEPGVVLDQATKGIWMRMFVKINGTSHYLWRAVDQHGNVLDILVQKSRDKKAAKRFFRKLLKGLQYVPRVIITDKLGSYSAAKSKIMPSALTRVGTKDLTTERKTRSNRPESGKRSCAGFKSAAQVQRFLSAAFGIINSHCSPSQTSFESTKLPDTNAVKIYRLARGDKLSDSNLRRQ